MGIVIAASLATPAAAIILTLSKASEQEARPVVTPKQIFSGDGLVVSYLRSIVQGRRKPMTDIASRSAFAINLEVWISCSHWGMFPVQR
jgi:hypothetical protein